MDERELARVDLFRGWLVERKRMEEVPEVLRPAWLEAHGFVVGGGCIDGLLPVWEMIVKREA